MKKFLSLALMLCLALPLWAGGPDGETDPMEVALHSISQYFSSKTYIADQRNLVEADLAIPEEIQNSLQMAELSFLSILRNEITARHGALFEDKTLAKIFQGTSWYRPASNDYVPKLNGFERNNLAFIEAKEKDIILKGEREIRGWNTYPAPPSPRRDEGLGRNVAGLEVLSASPTQVRCGGEIKVKVKVKNLGDNSWSPIGTNHTPETGKYYVSSCWYDPKVLSGSCLPDQFPLPRVVQPGETVEATGTVKAPSEPGTYYLVLDMLQAWVQRFLDIHIPDGKYEYEHCPKVMVKVVQ